MELNQSRTLSITLAYYGGGYLVALTFAHLMIRRFAPYADPVLLPLAALLNGIGLVMIYRLDLAAEVRAAAAGEAAPSAQAPAQLLWTGISLLLFLAVLMIIRDHTVLAKLLVHPAAGRARLPGLAGAVARQVLGGQRRADLDQDPAPVLHPAQ